MAGLAAGGRPGVASRQPVRWWPALGCGVGLQAAAVLADLDGGAATSAVVASYGLLVAVAAANLRVFGMAVVLAGLTLNLTSMVVHGGMPVRGSALVAAGLVQPAAVASVELGPKRHLETPADRLPVLGDVIPVRPLRQVLSIGDVVLASGVALVAFRLVKPTGSAAARHPRPVPGTAAGPPGGGV